MNQKIESIVVISVFTLSLIGMEDPIHFKFMAHIENMSKKPITYIPCDGDYTLWRRLDPQEIAQNVTLPIAPGQSGGIFELVVAGVTHNITNVPATVFAHLRRPHDMGATKRRSNGYRIEFDKDSNSCVPVIQGQCVYVKVDENDKITFEVKFDESAYAQSIKELIALQKTQQAV